MKRSVEEIEGEIATSKAAIKRAKVELAEHEDTLRYQLPAFLFKRLVACTPRILKRFHVKITKNVDEKWIAAGTLCIRKHRWSCDVEFADPANGRSICAYRWDDNPFKLPADLSWMDNVPELSDRHTIKEVWPTLLKATQDDIGLALAGLAFSVLQRDWDMTIMDAFPEDDSSSDDE
jgi:hypothetical protein